MPIDILQDNGFIFIWTINCKFRYSVKLMEHWGYKLVDELTWVKKTVNGKIAKGHGFYLQHAKETCLIGVKVIKIFFHFYFSKNDFFVILYISFVGKCKYG